MDKRKSRLKRNTFSALIYQIVATICTFILPRLILVGYGSDVNGLVNSITKFLMVISFADFGVGVVVQSALYKPLSKNDIVLVSKIVASGERYYKQLSITIFIYIFFVCIFFSLLFKSDYSIVYLVELIIAISIVSLSQYYFGVIDRSLLFAAQMGYLQYNIHTVLLIISTGLSVVMILRGCSIQAVKICTAFVFVLKPIIMRIFVNARFKIDRKIEYTEEPINQKWNGIFQHIAAVINDQVDIVVLTIFSSIKDVSIYSVYNMIAFGIKQILMSLVSGVQALMGDLLARQETEKVQEYFDQFEWSVHLFTVGIYGCTADLILPFVMLYTQDVKDTNYYSPLFAILLVLANAAHCVRLPYNIMIFAAGHYKQTQTNYIIAAIVNVSFSIVMVKRFGLVGVTIGTLVAMIYQTMWMAVYVYNNIVYRSIFYFIKQIGVDCGIVLVGEIIPFLKDIGNLTVMGWLCIALFTVIKWAIVITVFGVIFYKKKIISMFKMERKIF